MKQLFLTSEINLVADDISKKNNRPLVNFLVMPHWGSDIFKEYYKKMSQHAYYMKVPMIILTDTQYVWVTNELIQIVDVNK